MRCPDCSKFVSMDTETEPDVREDWNGSKGEGSVDVRIVNCCAECGNELKEANFEFTIDVSDLKHDPPLSDDVKDNSTLDVDVSRTHRVQGAGRGAKTFYGVEVSWKVLSSDGDVLAEGTEDDECPASAMDELL